MVILLGLIGTATLSTSVIGGSVQTFHLTDSAQYEKRCDYVSILPVQQTYNDTILFAYAEQKKTDFDDTIPVPVSGSIPVVLNGANKVALNWF
jgi:hypothetical protein